MRRQAFVALREYIGRSALAAVLRRLVRLEDGRIQRSAAQLGHVDALTVRQRNEGEQYCLACRPVLCIVVGYLHYVATSVLGNLDVRGVR